MSARVAPTTHVVKRCAPRHDGDYLILTLDGRSAVSLHDIPEGARVVLRDGKAERPQ